MRLIAALGSRIFTPSRDRKSTRLNSSHGYISYAVFCLKKKNNATSFNHLLQHHPTREMRLRLGTFTVADVLADPPVPPQLHLYIPASNDMIGVPHLQTL